ncbi:hypothetical protein [Caballeronia temeraria]|uniref:hypothetical protein n=1 Tax=Caballeronia temeraria TaxID=1777137 RepID=UPI000772C4DF|nr:hypothetical protein [Caballeronia temeraria]
MDTLRTFLNSLAPDEQDRFAADCGTSLGYIRKCISGGGRFSAALCIAIERKARTAQPDLIVRCEDLRPDLLDDWLYMRNSGCAEVDSAQGISTPITAGEMA